MKKHFWQQILVPLVLVFAILICGTSNVLGKYAGTNGRHLLASVEFGDTKISDAYIVVLNPGEEPTDEKIFVYPNGDPSTSIWGAGDPNADSYKTYGWNNAEELIFTVENRTDSPVEIEVVISVALPRTYQSVGIDVAEMILPYSLSEVCKQEGTSASTDGYLVTGDLNNKPANSIDFKIGEFAYMIGFGWLGLIPYVYSICTVTIPAKLTLINGHIHTYQFDFGTPELENDSGGFLPDAFNRASYKSIQIKAVSQ